VWEYYIQKDGKVRRMSEGELRAQLRKNKFTGFELVRRADEPTWQVLHEMRMFVEEVPLVGSPLDHARWKTVRGFGVHFLSYLAVNILVGFAPPVLLFWGIGIVLHGAKAVPMGIELWREGKMPLLPPPKELQVLPPATPPTPYSPPALGVPARGRTAPQAVVPIVAAVPVPPRADESIGTAPTVAWPAGSPPGRETAADSTAATIESRALRAAVKDKLFGDGAGIPVQIGRYRLGDRLGAGGMGVVFRAHDASLDRAVAMKLLRSGYEADAGTERLQREARAMARLSHPHVVTVYDVGAHEGTVFVAMEYVDGVTLREWLADPHSVGDVLSVLRQAGEGLAAAHEAGLVHRDFKPENVMVGRDGRVRVLDFGLAKPVDARSTAEHLTQTGTVLGTPRYMGPEQLRGELADAKSDQFALGVVLYEALYGMHPYEPQGDRPLPRAVLAGQLAPAPVRADVPLAVRDAICKAVAHDPDARHASIREMLAALGPIPTTSDELASLAAAVRRLLSRRGGAEAESMLAALQSIETVVAELDARAQQISSQVRPTKVTALREELAGAEAELASAEDDPARKVHAQRVEALRQRLSGIDRAHEVLERLRARRRIAETQLEQLHLDLTRAEAEMAELPDLTGPLQELRFQVDAAQEVEALLR
jgi:predicted Ser/Thr protein kinase